MNINALSSAPAQRTGAGAHSVIDRNAPPGITQEEWDEAKFDWDPDGLGI